MSLNHQTVRVNFTKINEPSSWQVVPWANIGASELFVYRISMEIPKLLDASMIFDPQRAEAKIAITTLLLEGFMPAFEHLRKIRTLAVVQPPEMNRRQLYEDFMRTLWHAYKDLLQIATREMGFDIGFLFEHQPRFKKGLKEFMNANPVVVKAFADYLLEQRAQWQNKLARARNDYLEHRKVEWEDVRSLYCIGQAEEFFESAWTVASDILVCLIHSKFPPHCGIEEIPVADRNPAHPDRFRFVFRGELSKEMAAESGQPLTFFTVP